MTKIPAIGIDLGTTFSSVAVWHHGKLEIIEDEQGKRNTPNYVAFNDTERLIGEPAKYQASRNSKNTIFDVKRLIGRKLDDPKTQDDMKRWPFTVINDNGKPKLQLEFKGETKIFDPAEIIAMILSRLVTFAEIKLGGKVSDAVITVPASFNHSQRQATKDAGAIAGLNVLRIINEPTAAALAYALPKNLLDKKTILIFDLGGGTFDVSIITIDRGSVFQVISTAGNTNLGGEDFDNRFVDYFAKEFKRKHNVDLAGNARALRRLLTACERAKCILSSLPVTTIEIDALYENIDFVTETTRATFENLNMDLFNSLILLVNQAITDAKMDKSRIDDVILVGGSTRIPKIQTLLENFFDGKKLNFTINPDEAVAYGAAMQATILKRAQTPQLQEIKIFDVTPKSLYVLETRPEKHKRLFTRNSSTPQRKSWQFVSDNQTTRKFYLMEGNNARDRDEHSFELIGISLLPKNERHILVTFDLDVDCILHVSAKHINTGQSEQIAITNNMGNLTNEEIDQMKLNVQKYQEEYERQRLKNLACHNFENYIVWCIKAIEDAEKEKLSEFEKKIYRDKCNAAMDWLDRNTNFEKKDVDKYLQLLKEEFKPILTKLFGDGQDRDMIDTKTHHGREFTYLKKETNKAEVSASTNAKANPVDDSAARSVQKSIPNVIDYSQMNYTIGNRQKTNQQHNTRDKYSDFVDQALPNHQSKIGHTSNLTGGRSSDNQRQSYKRISKRTVSNQINAVTSRLNVNDVPQNDKQQTMEKWKGRTKKSCNIM